MTEERPAPAVPSKVFITGASGFIGRAEAPLDRVWEVLTDHEHMADWTPFKSSEVLTRPGEGGEVGTVRKLSGGPAGLSLTETIVVAEEPYRMEYTTSGVPGTSFYHAFVTQEPTPAGKTKITWEAQFRSLLPGAGMITSATLRTLVKGLVTACE